MSQTVTELVITSNTQGARDFERAMDGAARAADKHLGGINASVEQFAASIRTLGIAGISLTATVGGVLQWAVEMNRQMADLQRNARQVGLTLDRFQSLRFAANIAGLDDRQFTDGMQRAVGLLNDAQREANSLSKLFNANGMSIRAANGQLIDSNKLLTVAADLVKRAATEQDKIKISSMLGFTREWIPLLEQGGAAIERMASEARAAGAVIDDSVIEKAAEFDRAWQKSSVEWSAKMKAAALEILPIVNDLVDKASQLLSRESLSGLAKQGKDQMGALGVPESANFKIELTPQAYALWDSYVKRWEDLKATIKSLADDTGVTWLLNWFTRSGDKTVQPGPVDVSGPTKNFFSQWVSVTPVEPPRPTIDWKAEADKLASYNSAIEDLARGVEIAAQGHSKIPVEVERTTSAIERQINAMSRRAAAAEADASATSRSCSGMEALRKALPRAANDNAVAVKRPA